MHIEDLKKLKKFGYSDLAYHLAQNFTSGELDKVLCFVPGMPEPDAHVAELFDKHKRERNLPKKLPIIIAPDNSSIFESSYGFQAAAHYDPTLKAVFLNDSTFQGLHEFTGYHSYREAENTLVHELHHAADDKNGKFKKINKAAAKLSDTMFKSESRKITRRNFLKGVANGVETFACTSALSLIVAPEEELSAAFNGSAVLGALAAILSIHNAFEEPDLETMQHNASKEKMKNGVEALLREISADHGTLKSLGLPITVDTLFHGLEPTIIKTLGSEEQYNVLSHRIKKAFEIFCQKTNLTVTYDVEKMIVQLAIAREVFGKNIDTTKYPSAQDRLSYVAALIAERTPSEAAISNVR